MSSSLTDTQEYRDFCRLAASDPAVFQTFRRQPEYEHIVRVSEEDGGRYLRRLEEPPVDATAVIGDPRMYSYPAYSVPLDPVMIRYHHDRQTIRSLFGPLEEMNVLEIGGGFGGLAHLLLDECGTYAICDLPEVRLLQDAYLHRWGQHVDEAEPSGLLDTYAYDLVVSTFAYSELKPDVARVYAADYLHGAARGWLVCNFLAPDQLHRAELAELLPYAEELPETPETHVTNRVYAWGHR